MKPTSNEPTKEDRMWKEELFCEVADADFTLQVMQKLDGVSMERESIKVAQTNRVSRKRWLYRAGIPVVAVILIAGGAWLASDRGVVQEQEPVVNAVNIPRLPDIHVPTELRSSFLTDDYKRLQAHGLVMNPNIHINDQGYQLKIEHVLVDRSQIIMTMQQTTPDGLGLSGFLSEMGRIHVTDEEGRQVATLARDTRTKGVARERLIFQLHDEIPDQVVVRGELRNLNLGSYYDSETKSYEDRDVAVDWSFQFNIDMTKAKSLAVETPMNNAYTTPEGLKLDMTQLVRTPNGTRLDLNVSLNDQLRAKVSEGWGNYIDILYHIEIPETNEYRIFNGNRPGARQAKFRLRDLSDLNKNEGQLKLSETWDPAIVTLDAKNVRFVLDGYNIPVKEETSVEVNLDKMRKDGESNTDSLQFEQFGDEFVFSNFKFEGNSSLVLEGAGTYENAFYGDQWTAIDAEGNEYPVELVGIPNSPRNNGVYVIDNLKLVIRGFTQENGTKFTLKREVVNREYQDVNWEVDLPSYASLPWQE